jgi:hypothetical protein
MPQARRTREPRSAAHKSRRHQRPLHFWLTVSNQGP